MPRVRAAVGLLTLLAGAAGAAGDVAAQAPVLVPVPVHVYVSLADSATRFFPVVGHRLIFYRATRDSVIVTTDANGAASLHLVPGQYRLVSSAPVGWHGYDYSWNVPVVITATSTVIDLRAPDAVTDRSSVRASAVESRAPADAPATDPAPVRYRAMGDPKEPATALVYSFLFPGGGQFYAHEWGNGTLSAAMWAGGVVLFVDAQAAAQTCRYVPSTGQQTCQGSSNSSKAQLGAAMVVGAWIGSMIDAPAAARRYNKARGLHLSMLPTPRSMTVALSLATP